MLQSSKPVRKKSRPSSQDTILRAKKQLAAYDRVAAVIQKRFEAVDRRLRTLLIDFEGPPRRDGSSSEIGNEIL